MGLAPSPHAYEIVARAPGVVAGLPVAQLVVDETATIDALVSAGYDVIFATSQPLGDPLVAAAKRYPDVRFGQARGSTVLPNLTTFSGADEEPIFLAGMAAAGTSKTGTIGFVGAVIEPETVRHVNAFTLGAQSVRPDVRVLLAWTGRWWDPEHEASLARSQVEAGADVIATGSVGTAVGDVANELGLGWVGHDADHDADYPRSWIAGAVPRWDRYYVRQVTAIVDGTWRSSAYYGSMADGFTTLSTIGAIVPNDVRALLEQRREALDSGTFDIFAGPIVDQAGVTRAPAGGSVSFDDRMTMDWLVKGVEGSTQGG